MESIQFDRDYKKSYSEMTSDTDEWQKKLYCKIPK